MGSDDDNLKMLAHERVGCLATSQASARRFQGEGAVLRDDHGLELDPTK